MHKLMLAGTAALLLMSWPTASFAKGNSSLENVPYAVKARCETLIQRFDEASANPKAGADLPAAKSAASQGSALCRASHYEEGSDTLEKALKLIGAPAN
jgi:hypothetical protein